jgi:hypothetical protein
VTPSTAPAAPAKVQLTANGGPLHATARLTSPSDSVRLQWDGTPQRDAAEYEDTMIKRERRQPPGLRDFPVEQATTWPGAPRVRVAWLTPDGGTVLQSGYAAMIADHGLGFSAERPSIVRFSGDVEVPESASYEFRVRADGDTRLLIDGRQELPRTDQRPELLVAPVRLTAGRHSVVLERSRRGGEVELYWRRSPNTAWELVPPEAFVPIAWP